MADVGNIKPVTPVAPRRPGKRVEPGRRHSDSDQRHSPAAPQDEREADDDRDHHIDEYA